VRARARARLVVALLRLREMHPALHLADEEASEDPRNLPVLVVALQPLVVGSEALRTNLQLRERRLHRLVLAHQELCLWCSKVSLTGA